jgi:hypothetical protein
MSARHFSMHLPPAPDAPVRPLGWILLASLDHTEENPLHGRVDTVGDLIQFFTYQEKTRNTHQNAADS